MSPKWLPRGAVAEVLTLWSLCFAAVAVSMIFSKTLAKLVATLGFLYLPVLAMQRRDEDYPDYGLSADRLRADLKQAFAVCAVVLPLFAAGYVGFIELLPLVPEKIVRLFTPYTQLPTFTPRLPPRFIEYVIDNVFVVALPEELFYRGYIQTRLRDAWPHGRIVFGARLGPAFWVTAVLFALGHLAIFEVWRLAVFFPALIFGWMRERSNSVVGPALFHAASNLTILVLDACYFGRG